MDDQVLARKEGARSRPPEHPTIAFFRAYWKEKRAGRTMPSRADIRPAELKDNLGWLVLLDVLEGGADFRYRLLGTLVTQYFLREATGKTVTEAFAPETPNADRNAVLSVFRWVAAEKRIFSGSYPAGTLGPRAEAFHAIYMPLSDDGTTCNVIMGAFVFDRSEVLLAREIAKSNGGELPSLPKRKEARVQAD